MKKTFVILTIVLAILAAPVFAEVTASGEVDFEWAFNADDYSEKVDSNDMVIDLGGTVGDFTSISAEFEGEYAEDDGDIDGVDGDGEDVDATVSLNQATLTQDVTGALGIESPVSASLTFGIKGIGDDPKNYNEVSAYNFASNGELDPGTIMTKLSLGIDTFTVDLSIWEDKKFGAEVYGNVAEIADVSVYYYKDGVNGSFSDLVSDVAGSDYTAYVGDTHVFGLNGAADVMEGLTIGVGYELFIIEDATVGDDTDGTLYDVSDDLENISKYGLSAAYTTGPLSAGASIYSRYYKDSDSFEYKFAENTTAAINVSYDVNDMLTPFAAFKTVLDAGDADFEDVYGMEIGLEAALDGVTYTTGYTIRSDWKAYDAGYTNNKDEGVGNFFIKVGAEF